MHSAKRCKLTQIQDMIKMITNNSATISTAQHSTNNKLVNCTAYKKQMSQLLANLIAKV